jgi:hypothetical protein
MILELILNHDYSKVAIIKNKSIRIEIEIDRINIKMFRDNFFKILKNSPEEDLFLLVSLQELCQK